MDSTEPRQPGDGTTPEAIPDSALRDQLIEQFGLPTKLAPPQPPRQQGGRRSPGLNEKLRASIAKRPNWSGIDRSWMVPLLDTLGFADFDQVRSFGSKIEVDHRLGGDRVEYSAIFTPNPDRQAIDFRFQLSSIRPPADVSMDIKGLAATLAAVFALPDLKIQLTRERPSGMTFHGLPAEFRKVELTTPVQSRDNALRAAQAARLLPTVIKVLDAAARDRVSRLTGYDWGAGKGSYLLNPETETTLGEVVEEAVFRDVLEYLENHPEVRFWRLTDYDARLSPDGIQTFVKREEWRPGFLNQPERVKVKQRLGMHSLAKPPPELMIERLDLGSAERPAHLPLREPVPLALIYYASADSLRRDLRNRFLNWYNQVAAGETRERKLLEEPAPSVRTFEEALKVFGLPADTSPETITEDLVRQLLVEMQKFHPDLHQTADRVTQQLANNYMSEVNQALDILRKHIPRRD